MSREQDSNRATEFSYKRPAKLFNLISSIVFDKKSFDLSSGIEVHTSPEAAEDFAKERDEKGYEIAYGVRIRLCIYPDSEYGRAAVVCGNYVHLYTWYKGNIFVRAVRALRKLFRRHFS